MDFQTYVDKKLNFQEYDPSSLSSNQEYVGKLKNTIKEILYPKLTKIDNFVKKRKSQEGELTEQFENSFYSTYNRQPSLETEQFKLLLYNYDIRKITDYFIKLQNENIKGGNYYYHGTIARLNVGDVLNPAKSSLLNQEKVVFATNMKSIALIFIPRWGNKDFNLSVANGKIILKEKYSGAFEKIFAKAKGVIAYVSPSEFQRDKRLGMYDNEFISKDSVTVKKVENVDNVWERLQQANDVELIKA